MKERLEKKLRKILAKEGLDEEKINAIVDEVDEANSEEDAQEGTNPEENPNPTEGENPVPPTPEEEEEDEDVPEEGEGATPPAEPAPEEPVAPVEGQPADGSIEQILNDFNPEQEGGVPPEGQPVPPAAEVPPAAPAVNPELEQAKAEIAEKDKAIEGLTKRLDSLEEALKKAGILEGEGTAAVAVGVEQNVVPEDKKDGFSGTLDEVLSQVNNKNY